MALEAIFCVVCARFVCTGWKTASVFLLDEDLEISPPVALHRLFLSMSCTGLVFMAPSMARMVMFWTLSSLLLLVLAAVPHVVDTYSITVAVYTLVRIDESAPQVVPASFLIRASFFRLPLSIFQSVASRLVVCPASHQGRSGCLSWSRSHPSGAGLYVPLR